MARRTPGMDVERVYLVDHNTKRRIRAEGVDPRRVKKRRGHWVELHPSTSTPQRLPWGPYRIGSVRLREIYKMRA